MGQSLAVVAPAVGGGSNGKLLNRPEEAAERLGCGRSQVYELMATGELESVKIGRLRRIPEAALVAFVESLRQAQGSAA